ncbi:MAG: oligoendopeptidase, partial [Solirubrobacterales bacterium]|nr:oligoendopeptidase [Solirubrobacterales bacterium]
MTATVLADVAWNLDDLVGADGPAGVDRLLDEAAEGATAFHDTYAGKVADLDGQGLSGAIAELAAIADAVGRAANYASLRFSTDTADPINGALIAKVQERGTAIETK